MRSIIVDSKGEFSEEEIDRRFMAQSFEIHLRDLRPVFALRQIATISPRGKCIIVNLRSLKLVIGAEKVIVLNIEDPDVSEKFIPSLLNAIKNNTEKHAFELLVLEVALTQKLSIVRYEHEGLEKSITKTLTEVQQTYTNRNLERLLNLKKSLSKLETKVKEIQEELVDILNDDDDMKSFYLSKDMTADEDFYAIESLLEFVEEPFEEIANNILEIKENIDDTQEFITFKVNNRRNSIIRFDLMATLVTGVFSFLAVITGIYGMNVRNNFGGGEGGGFWWIVGGVVFLALVLCIFIWKLMRRKNIF